MIESGRCLLGGNAPQTASHGAAVGKSGKRGQGLLLLASLALFTLYLSGGAATGDAGEDPVQTLLSPTPTGWRTPMPSPSPGNSSAARPSASTPFPTSDAPSGEAPKLNLTPTPDFSGDSSPTPTPWILPLNQAIELIWYGDYERAESALLSNLDSAARPEKQAEIEIYLALIRSIRQQPDEARASLRQALTRVPAGIDLDPVQFPPKLRAMLGEVQAELKSQRTRPKEGELADPVHVLSPPATPPGHAPRKKWYKRWYVWAGAGAAATVAVVLLAKAGKKDRPPTVTPTITPTHAPTPTPTPTQYVYREQILEVPSCDGSNDPFKGGETVHRFNFPAEPGAIQILEASLFVEVQGDYGPQTSDKQDKEADILIERERPIYAISPAPAFCSPIGRRENSQSNPNLIPQLNATLSDKFSPGVIEIIVRPGKDVIEQCKNGCNPFHTVNLEITYRYR